LPIGRMMMRLHHEIAARYAYPAVVAV
jgi:hypothetical protein